MQPLEFEASTPASGDGTRFWLENATPLKDREGRSRFVMVSVLDITARKRAEQELAESEAQLAFLDRLGTETAQLVDADAVLATTTRLLGEHLKLASCAYADMVRKGELRRIGKTFERGLDDVDGDVA